MILLFSEQLSLSMSKELLVTLSNISYLDVNLINSFQTLFLYIKIHNYLSVFHIPMSEKHILLFSCNFINYFYLTSKFFKWEVQGQLVSNT